MTLTFASTFAGIGGFDLGLERAGMTPLWHCEIDPAASAVLAHHWPEVPNLGDISTIDGTRLRLQADRRPRDVDAAVHRAHADGDEQSRAGRPDLLCGGFPCQDLSVAGRRKGLDGARSGLFFEFARLADELQPRWVLLENVAGLLSSAAGRDFAVLLHTLADIGYEDLSWRVVDSLNFGVPQRRRRVLIVGHLGAGTATREVLLEPEGRPWSPPQGGQAGPGVAPGAARSVAFRGRDGGPTAELGDEAAFTLRASQGGGDKAHALVSAQGAVAALTAGGVGTCGADDNQAQAGHLIAAHETGQGWWNEADHAGTLRAEGENRPSRPSHLIASAGHHGHSSPRGDGTDNLVPSFATTLQSVHRGVPSAEEVSTRGGADQWGGQVVPFCARVRRLTPTECERLQGFPDGWTLPAGSDSARYRCLGNAVTVQVIEWIGRRIVAYEAGTLGALSPDPVKQGAAA